MMEEVSFGDVLYGSVSLPAILEPFLRIPEFVRLRGVRLSNVDSYQFKDLSGPNRWEHGIAVAALSYSCARARGLSTSRSLELTLAGLLHDVATPPFAHTAEYVLSGFSHEIETYNILGGRASQDVEPSASVWLSELPQFLKTCERLNSQSDWTIDCDEVARMVVGGGELGWLVSGTIDLDNIDNVVRASHFMGLSVDTGAPLRLATWLARQDSCPVDLDLIGDPDVRLWIGYRKRLYETFYEAGEAEKGREAFLQHLMRRADTSGVPRRQIIWNTDEGLLQILEQASSEPGPRSWRGLSLPTLVKRYRLLDPVNHVCSLEIDDPKVLRSFLDPRAAGWLESHLASDQFQPFVVVDRRRSSTPDGQPSLLPEPTGSVRVYKLGGPVTNDVLPTHVVEAELGVSDGASGKRALANYLTRNIGQWSVSRPWIAERSERLSEALRSLDAIGDWSFYQSRNETLHSYPSTFVHAIPAAFINSLCSTGDMVLDPFGGTGQTALEGARRGLVSVSADCNSVASLIARVRLSYLNLHQRQRIRGLAANELRGFSNGAGPPSIPDSDRWHHPQSFEELVSVRGYIQAESDPKVREFFLVCFSAILTGSTARRGRQHGFFADNTPLPKGLASPPYQPVIDDFLKKAEQNLRILERTYATFIRRGVDPEVELTRATAIESDVRGLAPLLKERFGKPAAIITSPPYLAMSDYVLGQRLSYYWLFSDRFDEEFQVEIAPRRSRFSPTRALSNYRAGMDEFAHLCADVLELHGHVAAVVGSPTAKAFAGVDAIGIVVDSMNQYGFQVVWSAWRNIHWHRNQGYQRLARERLLVFGRS